jgi:hypothetical protein
MLNVRSIWLFNLTKRSMNRREKEIEYAEELLRLLPAFIEGATLEWQGEDGQWEEVYNEV